MLALSPVPYDFQDMEEVIGGERPPYSYAEPDQRRAERRTVQRAYVSNLPSKHESRIRTSHVKKGFGPLF